MQEGGFKISCVAPGTKRFSLDPCIICEVLRGMCLGGGVWGLCGIRGCRLIFFWGERGGRGAGA